MKPAPERKNLYILAKRFTVKASAGLRLVQKHSGSEQCSQSLPSQTKTITTDLMRPQNTSKCVYIDPARSIYTHLLVFWGRMRSVVIVLVWEGRDWLHCSLPECFWTNRRPAEAFTVNRFASI